MFGYCHINVLFCVSWGFSCLAHIETNTTYGAFSLFTQTALICSTSIVNRIRTKQKRFQDESVQSLFYFFFPCKWYSFAECSVLYKILLLCRCHIVQNIYKCSVFLWLSTSWKLNKYQWWITTYVYMQCVFVWLSAFFSVILQSQADLLLLSNLHVVSATPSHWL